MVKNMLKICILLLWWVTSVDAQDDFLMQQQWQHRLLIGIQDDQQAWQDLMSVISAGQLQQDLKERKLQFWVVIDEQLYRYGTDYMPQDTSSVIHAIQQRLSVHQQPGYALIGLDGGIKYHYPGSQIDIEKILMSIDRMPMRQAELKSKQD